MSESEPRDEASRSRRRGSTRVVQRIALVLGGCFLLYVLVGFLLLPRVAERFLVEAIVDQTGITPEISAVRFNPFTLCLGIEGFALPDAERGGMLVGFDVLSIDANLVGFLSADVALDSVVLERPRVDAELAADGGLNLSRLWSGPAAEAEEEGAEVEGDEATEPLVIDAAHLRVSDGAVSFRDASKSPSFEVALTAIDFELDRLSTRAGTEAPYRLELALGDATRLRWKGSLGLEPLASAGQIELESFDLRVPWQYLSEGLRFEIADGRLGVGLRYAFEGGDALSVALEDGSLELRNLEILDRTDREPVIALPSVSLSGIGARASAAGLESLAIEDVDVDRGALASYRAPDGSLQLVDLFAPAEPSNTTAEPATPGETRDETTDGSTEGAGPALRIGRTRVAGFEVAFEDRVPAEPVSIRLAPLELEIRDLRSGPNDDDAVASGGGGSDTGSTSMRVDLASGLGEGGRLALRGPVSVGPLSGRLGVELEAIRLRDFESYLASVARLGIAEGTLSTALEVDLAEGEGGGAGVRVTGSARIDELETFEPGGREPFLGWKRFELSGIEYATAPDAKTSPAPQLAIEEIALSVLRARIALDANGETNLSRILTPSDANGGASEGGSNAGSAGSSAAPAIRIARIRLDDVAAQMEDRSVEPAFSISLDDLTGTIEGLSSDPSARARVTLAGMIDRTAPIEIDGEINPLASRAFTDLRLEASGISLPAFSPYSGRYVGRAIDQGKLGARLHYALKANHLEASNDFRLERFRFGERIDSSQATRLPVALAVEVLRDMKGNIEVPLPIAGDLDDPGFDLFSLLRETLTQLISRVATSPFAVVAGVAGVVGAAGDELASVDFEVGSDRLSEKELGEIDLIVKVLAERPSLYLDIQGRADPGVDVASTPGASAGGNSREPDSGEATGANQAAGDDWRALARARALAVQDAILATQQIDAARVYLREIGTTEVDTEGRVATQLALRAR